MYACLHTLTQLLLSAYLQHTSPLADLKRLPGFIRVGDWRQILFRFERRISMTSPRCTLLQYDKLLS